ncbi:MAG: hypothetical protein ABJC09_08415, partial [Terriglobia bacterium]
MEPNDGNDYLFWWLVPALVCLCVAFAWSNHFGNGFHWDDFPGIVNNRAIQSVSLPRFFAQPRTSSELPEQTQYRPLLTTSFALNRAVAGGEPWVFQLDTFVWFAILIGFIYALFRVLPGSTHLSAAVGAGLFAVHPAIADTVNYVSRRGTVIAALGIVAGLAIRIVWPKMLPNRLWVDTRRTTVNWQEDLLIARAARRNALYRRFIHMPLGLYLIPVALAMLVDPIAALFAPLLAVYLWLFEPEDAKLRRVLPAAILCGGYFLFATFLTWRFDSASRIPFPNWVPTEMFIVARYLFYFIAPVNLSPDSGMKAFTLGDWPLVIGGIGVVVGMIALAMHTARRTEWRAVSFGLWWFLITLLPTVLLPGSMVDANHRMFLPFIGLALAFTRAAWLLAARLSVSLRVPALAIGFLLCGVVLAAASWGTFERNKIWESEETLWQTALRMSPQNGRALTRAGEAAFANADSSVAHEDLGLAEPLVAGNASLETALALAFDQLGDDTAAQKHFQLAVTAGPDYARAWSAWSRWLFLRQKRDEAFRLAGKAILLEPTDATAAHTLIDVYSQRFDWDRVKATAQTLLAIYPYDEAARNSLVLAN